jgi:hypothetical protein
MTTRITILNQGPGVVFARTLRTCNLSDDGISQDVEIEIDCARIEPGKFLDQHYVYPGQRVEISEEQPT